MALDPDMRAIADRLEITDLIHRYCRAVDRLDVPLGQSIWHEDGHADYGADIYQGAGPGVIDHICAQHRKALHHAHLVTNILIELDGDRAGSEACHFASLRIARGGALHQISVWGRYIDRWSRRQGSWGLDHRLTVRDFDEIRAVTPMGDHALGRRDRHDPSYGVLTRG
jgi:hypothetical protein